MQESNFNSTYYKRLNEARKTGIDPATKVASPKPTKFRLIETRTLEVLIEGSMALVKWKKKMHLSQNPTAKYRIEPVL